MPWRLLFLSGLELPSAKGNLSSYHHPHRLQTFKAQFITLLLSITALLLDSVLPPVPSPLGESCFEIRDSTNKAMETTDREALPFSEDVPVQNDNEFNVPTRMSRRLAFKLAIARPWYQIYVISVICHCCPGVSPCYMDR